MIVTEGLQDVIIYRSADKENQKNRGFAFLEYDSHKSASTTKWKLSSGRSKVWNCYVIVDWADPIEELDNVTMAKVEIRFNSVVVILCVLLYCTVCKDYNYTETRNKLINKDTTYKKIRLSNRNPTKNWG